MKRLKEKIRERTNRRSPIPMEIRLEKLRQLMTGWINYYQLAEMTNEMRSIDGFVRRRLRMIRWREWKTSRNRAKNLVILGMRKDRAWKNANTRKGEARIAQSLVLTTTLTNQHFREIGYREFHNYYLYTINVQNYFQLISNYTIQMQKEKTLTQILV